MKTTKRTGTRSLLLAAGLCLALAAPIAAQGRGGGPGPGARGAGDGPGLADRWAERLDLTDEQKTAIEAIREEGRAEAATVRKEMMRLRHALRGEMLEDEPDLGAAKSLTEKLGTLRTRLEVQRLEHRMAIRELLTPGQRDRMVLGGGRGWDDDGPGRGRGGRGPGHGFRGHRGGAGGPGCGGGPGGPGCDGPGPGWCGR